MKQSKKEDPKPSVKFIVNPKSETEPKGKEKPFNEEPIIDNNSQLDLPITLKAFRFRSFVKVVNVQPTTDSGANPLLFSFYLKHIKPQYKTWSASKITAMKVIGPIETDRFPNVKFKVARGSSIQVHEFTLADLPYLNPYY
ncbi:unnamed protein product [Lactuca saligna]|uniref:Uncharacterized protein n=1 Tax=Lactuca saligna TaxID=75948 RepID=A0AA35ZBU7_LACSI|nr:unnamed protein product [Lactuca saligna]